MTEKLAELRELIEEEGIDAYFLPNSDNHSVKINTERIYWKS